MVTFLELNTYTKLLVRGSTKRNNVVNLLNKHNATRQVRYWCDSKSEPRPRNSPLISSLFCFKFIFTPSYDNTDSLRNTYYNLLNLLNIQVLKLENILFTKVMLESFQFYIFNCITTCVCRSISKYITINQCTSVLSA